MKTESRNEHKKRTAATDKSNVPSCHECHKEISKSAAITSEGKDYIWHFCSQDCYKRFKQSRS